MNSSSKVSQLYKSIYLNPLNIVWSVFNSIMLMFCNVGLFVFRTTSFEAKVECGFVGHRFDENTSIAETVSVSTSEVDDAIGLHV